jgi:8-oxo-dGTP pyrophosphatase MutT (NUDIX family)
MQVAAGILFHATTTGRVLLCRRTDTGEWCFPGGGKLDGETIEQCAIREALEETGYLTGHTEKLLSRRVKNDVDFSTFLYKCAEDFVPKLNNEHDTFVWVTPDAAENSLRLHPGCRIALRMLRGGVTELDLAEAIRDEELVSPQYIEKICLVNMRISGTGFSYRPSLDEWVFRREAVYLTPEFMARCNGLPIIMDHPPDKVLDSDEFTKRIVGTMFLPYIKDDEIWGVAKIWNNLAIHAILNHELSTSPSVVFREPKVNYNIDLDDGGTLLVEGNPTLIDHLAICKKGVWDKGGEPDGIRIDSEATGEPQEHTVTAKPDEGALPAPSLPPTGAGGTPAPGMQGIPPKLVDLVSGLNSFSERLDKFMARRDLMVR